MSRDLNNQIKTSVDILRLPTEVLSGICALFCAHCTNEKFGDHYDYYINGYKPITFSRPQPRPKASWNTLKNLTVVSKRFRSICLPLLVHRPYFNDRDRFQEFWQFLNRNQYLTYYVRQVESIFASTIANAGHKRHLTLENADGPASSFASVEGPANEQLTFLPVRCPGLEELILVDLDLVDVASRIQSYLEHFRPLVFDNLRSVTIRCVTRLEEYVPHWVTLLNFIFISAPALHTLRIRSSGPSLLDSEDVHNYPFKLLSSPRKLRRLIIQGYTSPEDGMERSLLKEMFRTFKGVEEFYFQSLDSYNLSYSSEITQVALPCKDTLRVLDVQIGDHDSHPYGCANELSSFPVLEKLIMNAIFFYPPVPFNEADIKRCLVDVIPISVRLRMLAEEMSRGRFPNLRHIIIARYDWSDLEWKRDNDDIDGGFLQFFLDAAERRLEEAKDKPRTCR
ncbi:hypothetical protein E4U55_006577 [Claviceps digitariae]|nr:hypothetical protein E4U55_006577 [Claviceps digitariae]